MNQPFAVREFRPTDLAQVQPGKLELKTFVPEQLTAVSFVQDTPVRGFTALRDDLVKGCLGMSLVTGDEQAWFMWAVLSDEIRRHPVWMYKSAISILDVLSKQTKGLPLYALVHEDAEPAHRMAVRVGFEPTHWKRKFPPDTDYYDLYRYG